MASRSASSSWGRDTATPGCSAPPAGSSARSVLDHLTVRRLHREPGSLRGDLLHLQEVVEAVVSELAPHAALLVAAPDAFHGLRVVVPDPHGPGADPPGHAHGA